MSTNWEIEDQKYRISKSGYSIKTGYGDQSRIVAKYPGLASPMDHEQFRQWMDDAEHICDLHNALLLDGVS